ncbi:putative CDP-diacylglycerol--glycerol-3-phosphate 3-phosphatidyltransferase [Candidatus Microthrix parvicella RN1]|uniref:Putative CDP-diacylglycerol--glycerol-3-phosphate 3-phosphatidyltransferase n=1 Tax=Candidatus Neomicrothrix parvicella RN1 TaxID=1229780 RepID=R4Z6E4_9ACTN|nr:putative CDP-diacylglycerol--glycerol-3-phosphate 3-phosphatidyltransferase [Candidatus Microthrix parvicella RN1]
MLGLRRASRLGDVTAPSPQAAANDPAAAAGDDGPSDAELSRILTVPNVVTLIRLALIPVFLWVLFGLDRPGPAAVLLGFISATDWVDGYVARHFNQVSNLGKAIDPAADRALIIFGFGGILVAGAVPTWAGIVVLAREIGMSVWVLGLLAAGAKRMDVTWYGKAGTMCLMISFPSFLASTDLNWSHGVTTYFEWQAWLTLIPGLIFSFIAVTQYIPRGLTALHEGRAARSTSA